MTPPNPASTAGAPQGNAGPSSRPEHGSGPHAAASTPPVPTPRQRDPPTFSGATGQDIEDWLSSYERVGMYNRWDDTTKLANVVFYLEGLAKTWFENHEAEFTTWSYFRDRLCELFGKPTVRKANAIRKLSTRYQRRGESYAAYIEDVIALCSRADPTMPEQEKIANIMKGIAEEAFQYLLLKDPATVTDVIHACTTLQEKRNTRLPQVSVADLSPVSQQPDVDGLHVLIRELIREELASGCLQPSPETTDLRVLGTNPPTNAMHALVREEVAAALRPDAAPPVRPTYADVLRTAQPVASQPPFLVAQPSPPLQTLAPLYPRPFNDYSPPIIRRRETRTCFYCGIQGHIARFCRRRQQDFGAAASHFGPYSGGAPSQRGAERRVNDYAGHPPPDRPYSRGTSPPPPRRRSVSPFRGRSPAREPLRLRTPSPQGNQ